jgi:hypothetical protein
MAPHSTLARTIDDRSPVSAGVQLKPTTGPQQEPVAAPAAAATGRGVLGGAFAVLEALAQADAGLGLTGLARASGLAKTLAYRLAEQRVALGAVQRVDQRYYVGAWREGVETPNRMSTILTSRDIPARCNLTGTGRRLTALHRLSATLATHPGPTAAHEQRGGLGRIATIPGTFGRHWSFRVGIAATVRRPAPMTFRGAFRGRSSIHGESRMPDLIRFRSVALDAMVIRSGSCGSTRTYGK